MEFAASGFFAETAFFNDVLCAEVCPGAYLVFEDRYAGAFLILADNRYDLTVRAPESRKFNILEDEQVRHFKTIHCFVD